MPVVLRNQGYKFFFYSNEEHPLEPAHIHARLAGKEAKFWLSPEVSVARNDGFDARSIRILLDIVEQNRNLFEEKWHGYFT